MRHFPGAWVDEHGGLHIALPEFLAALGLPNTEENRRMAQQEIAAAMKTGSPATVVIARPDEFDRRYDHVIGADGRPLPESN